LGVLNETGRDKLNKSHAAQSRCIVCFFQGDKRMSNPWIRLYRASLHNPKTVTLSDRQHRCWHNLLLIADDRGELPRARDIACHLRMSVSEVEQLLCELVEAELVDVAIDKPNTFRMHDWETHQYASDTSTDRVRKFRNKNKCNDDETFLKRDVTVTVTPPEAEPDTDSDTDYVPSPSLGMPREAKEQGFNSSFGRKGGRSVSDRLKAKAEGLGLDVAALEARALAPDVRIPNALFRKLVVNDVRGRHPIIDETLIKAALTNGNDAAWGQLQAMLVGAA
jgi:hypothetical protein